MLLMAAAEEVGVMSLIIRRSMSMPVAVAVAGTIVVVVIMFAALRL